jgi:hypothetical protein
MFVNHLRPVRHGQHLVPPRLGSSQGLGRGSHFNRREGVSFQAPSTEAKGQRTSGRAGSPPATTLVEADRSRGAARRSVAWMFTSTNGVGDGATHGNGATSSPPRGCAPAATPPGTARLQRRDPARVAAGMRLPARRGPVALITSQQAKFPAGHPNVRIAYRSDQRMTGSSAVPGDDRRIPHESRRTVGKVPHRPLRGVHRRMVAQDSSPATRWSTTSASAGSSMSGPR